MNLGLMYLNKVYNIKHCIHCGKKDFDSFEAVLDHVKKEHTDGD